MIEKITIEGKRLSYVSSGARPYLTFDYPIKEVKVRADQVFVILDIPQATYMNQNIFCYDLKGELVWQVQDPDTFGPESSKQSAAFMGFLNDTEDGSLKAVAQDSHVYTIEPNTGKLLDAKFSR